MYKLLMRAFPGWYKFNSIYAMFPFSLPEKTREVQEKLGWGSLYSFDKPAPPAKPMDFIRTYDACVRVLDDQEHFQMSWGPAIKELTGTEYMLSGDGEKYAAMHKRLHKETMGCNGSEKAIWEFYINITNELIKTTSFKIGTYFEMDAVREYPPARARSGIDLADGSVGNIAIVNFFARLFNFPLKNAQTPGGLITQEELFEILGAIFTFLFFNGDEASGLKLKSATVSAYAQVSQLVKLKVEEIKVLGKLDAVVDDLKNPKGFLHLYGDNLIRRMLKDGNSVDEIVTQILLTSTGAINLSPQVLPPLVEVLMVVCANHRPLLVGGVQRGLGRHCSLVET